MALFHGAPAVHIAGRPVTGLKYMTYRLDERYVQQFATTGVEIVGFGCACGEHPYGLAADTWFAQTGLISVKSMHVPCAVLSAHPQAFLLPHLRGSTAWWVERYPDECVVAVSADGKRIDYQEPAGHRPGSWASARWRADMGSALTQFVQHLRTAPYADRVIGLLICAGTTEEWMLPGSNTADWTDYSQPAVEGFRKWLAAHRHRTTNCAAWRDSQATLLTAAPPQLTDAVAAGAGELVDPNQGRRLPDWWLYTSDLTADTIEHYARIVKRFPTVSGCAEHSTATWCSFPNRGSCAADTWQSTDWLAPPTSIS